MGTSQCLALLLSISFLKSFREKEKNNCQRWNLPGSCIFLNLFAWHSLRAFIYKTQIHFYRIFLFLKLFLVLTFCCLRSKRQNSPVGQSKICRVWLRPTCLFGPLTCCSSPGVRHTVPAMCFAPSSLLFISSLPHTRVTDVYRGKTEGGKSVYSQNSSDDMIPVSL